MLKFTKFATFEASRSVADLWKQLDDAPDVKAVLLKRAGSQLYAFTLEEIKDLLKGYSATKSIDSVLESARQFGWQATPKVRRASAKISGRAVVSDSKGKPKTILIETEVFHIFHQAPPPPPPSGGSGNFLETFQVDDAEEFLGEAEDEEEMDAAGDGGGAGASAPAPALREVPETAARSMTTAETADVMRSSAEPQAALANGEGATVTRWPRLKPEDVARPGESLTIEVDLSRTRPKNAPDSSAMKQTFDEDWTEEDIDVRLSSALIDFGSNDHGAVKVRRDRKSIPCRITGTVQPSAAEVDEIEVVASFSYKGRYSGSSKVTVQVVTGAVGLAAGAVAGAGITPSSPATRIVPRAKETPGVMTALTAAKPADLTVHILYLPVATQHLFVWTLEPRQRWDWLPGELSGTLQLSSSPAEYFQTMLSTIAKQRGSGVQSVMDGLGQRIFDETPPQFKKLYWTMREKLGDEFAIQFVTNDPNVPWELMSPYDNEKEISVGVLARQHPVGRWLTLYEGNMPATLPSGDVYTIAPTYEERSQTEGIPKLPIALAISKELESDFNAKDGGTTYNEIEALLEGKTSNVALLHIGAHGKFIGQAADASCLYLDDKNLIAIQVRTPAVTLGTKCRTFVILNACQVGTAGAVMDAVGGWAEAFLNRHFSGVIAPLWSVYDDHAGQFTKELLDRIWTNKQPVGQAMRDIRKQLGNLSATFYAYVYYGDVMAHFN